MIGANAQIVESDSKPFIDYLSLALGKWLTNNVLPWCWALRSPDLFFFLASLATTMPYW